MLERGGAGWDRERERGGGGGGGGGGGWKRRAGWAAIDRKINPN